MIYFPANEIYVSGKCSVVLLEAGSQDLLFFFLLVAQNVDVIDGAAASILNYERAVSESEGIVNV